MTIDELQKKTKHSFEAADVSFAGVFGSVARGTGKLGSDVDIMVRFRGRRTLLDFFALQDALEATLNRKVDLVTERSLDPKLKDAILEELKPIYGRR